MTKIGSKISESGTSNDTIHNTSSPNEVEVDIEASKKRKAMEPRAACWKHFEKFIDEDGATKAKCNYCGKTYAAATKESMRDKFRKYWGEPDNMNKMIFISAVLDPRNKLDYVRFAIGDMFGKTIGEPLVDAVDKYMKALFDHYVKKSSKVSLFSSSSPTSSGNSSSISSVSGDDNFQKRGSMRTKLEFVRHKVVSGSSSSKSELGRYLAEDVEPETDHFDILKWWKFNEPRFPILSEMARDVLAIPISSVASECAFSTGGRILDPFRSSLTPKLVQALISLQDWYRSEPIPINVEEDLEYLELLELDMAHSGNESSIVDV